jgi:hypothetical protein
MAHARVKNPQKRCEELIDQGKITDLLAHMGAHPHLYEMSDVMGAARQALAMAATGQVSKVVETVYRLMITFCADLLLLAQLPLATRLTAMEDLSSGGDASCARKAVDQQLPHIQSLHHHLIALTRAYATVTHTLKLAENSAELPSAPVLKLVNDTERLGQQPSAKRVRA